MDQHPENTDEDFSDMEVDTDDDDDDDEESTHSIEDQRSSRIRTER